MTLTFIARRVVHGILLLVAISVLTFALTEIVPGDFFDDIKLDPSISRDTAQGLRVQYGLNQKWPVRYARWVESALRGEFGISFAYNLPASQLLRPRILNTLLLTLVSLFAAWGLALPLAMISARYGRSILAATTLLIAVPDLIVAFLALYFAARTGWLPAGGMRDANGEGLLLHLLLPALVLTVCSLPVLIRHIRSALLEVSQAPYIRAARAHGVGETRLWTHHILPAAMNPITALAGLSIAGLLSSSLLVEVIFSWPGLGPLLVEAIAARDIYLILGSVLSTAAFVIAGNLAGDLLLAVCDPRIRWRRS